MLSILTFKREFKKVFNQENLKRLVDFTKEQICSYVKKNLLGVEKKDLVVEAVTEFILLNFKSKNSIVMFFVSMLINFIPDIVQFLYDSLREYVDGLTEKS